MQIIEPERFYLTGSFQSTNTDFEPGAISFLMNSAGNSDAFLVKYYWPPTSIVAGTLQGNTICGSMNGQLTFTATAGTAPFTLVYTDGINNYTQTNVQSGIPFNLQVNPTATTPYTLITVQDIARCSGSANPSSVSTVVTVNNPAIVTNADQQICRGASVQLNTIGAQTYSWTPAATLSDPTIPNPVATPTTNTQYIVTGTNANGCIAKDTVNITLFNPPAITISNDTAICKNTSVSLLVMGGSTYSWDPSPTLASTSTATPVASPTSDTWYYVTITDNNLCFQRDSVKVTIRPDPTFSISGDSPLCLGSSVQLNASGGDSYDWQPASGLNNSMIASPIASPGTTQSYIVTISESVCNHSKNLSTTVTVNPLPVVSVSKSSDIDCSNNTSQLIASGASTYTWLPAATLNNPTISNPIATPVVTTDYFVKGTDANGCINTGMVTVKVEAINGGKYLMASGFTPNGDGLNDCYGVKLWGIIQEIEFSIYNRWGERVFYSTVPGACWDGVYKGVKQDGNVFVYMVKAKTLCAPTVFRKGTFVLIR